MRAVHYRLKVWVKTRADSTWREVHPDDVPKEIMDKFQARLIEGQKLGILAEAGGRTWKWDRVETDLTGTHGGTGTDGQARTEGGD